MKFKVGDKVKFVDTGNSNSLDYLIDKTATITKAFDGVWVDVKWDDPSIIGNLHGWLDFRFELVEESELERAQKRFPVGSKALCVNTGTSSYLSENRVYTVENVFKGGGDKIFIRLDEIRQVLGDHSYYIEWFQPVSDRIEDKVNRALETAVDKALDKVRTELLDSLRTQLNETLNLNLGA